MKFINPSYEVLPIPEPTDHMDVLKHLERIGRVCYKSEDKITDESCVKFIKMIRDRKHWAMLEHYIFALSVPEDVWMDFNNVKKLYRANHSDYISKRRFINTTYWDDAPNEKYKYIISGSATSFNYIWDCFKNVKEIPIGIAQLLSFMNFHYPELMKSPYPLIDTENLSRATFNPWYSKIEFISRSILSLLPFNLRILHDFVSVKYTVNHGVTHELVRHRPCSWAQESTRYVNYRNKGCQFIIPLWLDESDKEVLLDEDKVNSWLEYPILEAKNIKLSDVGFNWFLSAKTSEELYNRLLNVYKRSPQEARGVLTNDIKAEIIQTATLQEMIHFFNMRCPKSAHPQMREVTVPLLAEMGEKIPDVFKFQASELLSI